MRILIVAPNWIGDAVMSLSLIQALHQDPKLCDSEGNACEIHVLAPSITAPVYQFSAAVSSVQAESFLHGKVQLGLRRRVGKSLAKQGFDLALVLPNSLKAALVPWFAGIPKRVGYRGELRSVLLTDALPKPHQKSGEKVKLPMLQWYGNLGGFALSALQNPILKVTHAPRMAACSEFGLLAGFLAMAPGAEFGAAKRWPVSHFARVATEFLRLNPAQHVVLLGGPNDKTLCEQIMALLPVQLQVRMHGLAGQTSLEQAVALVSVASQLVTNDSGLMHVAAALGVQVHAVFGSSSPHHTPPVDKKAKVYFLNLDCSPCFKRECPLGHTNCLEKLSPELVVAQLGLAAQEV